MTRAGALAVWHRAVVAARRIVGIPDYEAYVAHVRTRHPERAVLSRAEFFADRQRARYSGGGRCC
jgi:uncharacterized short protein YbdD (DUF466 family)